jgi:hypothetical protein
MLNNKKYAKFKFQSTFSLLIQIYQRIKYILYIDLQLLTNCITI